MPGEIESFGNILIELNKAVKTYNFYPAGHPNLDRGIDKCFAEFRRAIDEFGEVKWKVDQKGFYVDKTPIAAGNRELLALAKRFFFRRIREITLNPRLTPEDLKSLLAIINLEPADIQSRGGIESLFAEMDVEGVLINKMDYEDLKRLKDEIEEKNREKEELSSENEDSEGEAAAAEEEPPPPEPEPEKTEEEPFTEFVKRLRAEKDPINYRDLSVRVTEKAPVVKADGRLDELTSALMVLGSHASTGADPEIRSAARDAFTAIMDPDVADHLIERVGRKDEDRRKELQKLLYMAGEGVIDKLLNALVDAPEASRRRNYYDTLLLFGKKTIPYLDTRLTSDMWYVVRQAVSLLGELGDPEVLSMLEDAYANPDPRVKKEVLKSLVKVPSPRARELIVKALDEQDTSLRNQAIICLGVMKDAQSVGLLGKIAVKWDPFSDSLETRREAVKALGMIGSPEAEPYLTKLLFKKSWFGNKANEDIRALAAASLGMIGTDGAYQAVEKVCDKSEGELYSTCKRILEARER